MKKYSVVKKENVMARLYGRVFREAKEVYIGTTKAVKLGTEFTVKGLELLVGKDTDLNGSLGGLTLAPSAGSYMPNNGISSLYGLEPRGFRDYVSFMSNGNRNGSKRKNSKTLDDKVKKPKISKRRKAQLARKKAEDIDETRKMARLKISDPQKYQQILISEKKRRAKGSKYDR